jgi:two-component system, OmpR family, phosphate regulon sensor histidine kinase PhoR
LRSQKKRSLLFVNEHFSDKRNEEIGVFLLILNKKFRMKIITPKQVAIGIAMSSALLFILLIILIFRFSGLLFLGGVIVGVVLLFSAIFFLTNYLITNFIFDKIKPIYKIIFKTDILKRELNRTVESADIIADVEKEVNGWAKNKTNEIDQLKQLEKYRREFLGNVSHELKTPIFNIQGYILTLLDGGLEDFTINRLYLERAEKNINRLINIVEDLESISQLEAGELKLDFEDFNIVNLVYDVFEMQEMLSEKQKIKLVLGGNYEKPVKVNADKKRIIEVMNNLIVNSIKYGKSKGKTVVSFLDLGDQVMVEVSDNGIGIMEKDLNRIFERFYRTDKSRSRDQGGTGLGLSIVKHIIEAHGQSITVRSLMGEGTTFTFTLNKATGK